MGLVKSCCGLWELKQGARNIAVIAMAYDLLASAGLLLILLLHVPNLPWADPPEDILLYQILLIVSISMRVIHMIPSFLLLYSTWEEVQRGVCCWLVLTSVDVLVHGAWLLVPLVKFWPIDKSLILVTSVLLGIVVIIYFILVVSAYLTWLRDRELDIRARRRLKEFY